MKLYKSVLMMGLVAASLTGCVETWSRPGGTQPQLNADEANCLDAATAKFPVHLETFEQPDHQETRTVTPPDPHCDSQCEESGSGSYTEWVPTPPETIDTNATNRVTEKNICVQASGWMYRGKEFDPFNPNSFVVK